MTDFKTTALFLLYLPEAIHATQLYMLSAIPAIRHFSHFPPLFPLNL